MPTSAGPSPPAISHVTNGSATTIGYRAITSSSRPLASHNPTSSPDNFSRPARKIRRLGCVLLRTRLNLVLSLARGPGVMSPFISPRDERTMAGGLASPGGPATLAGAEVGEGDLVTWPQQAAAQGRGRAVRAGRRGAVRAERGLRGRAARGRQEQRAGSSGCAACWAPLSGDSYLRPVVWP